ncbi:hypothetical protein RHMOL_Rhmol05G0195200 [Rhododendron molle]|uniref:Uncharacterized protein n=1 Tax=Rhododendron molle TaxID=49168 RepID=A0ACC0NRX0_RHOML|nr:hypothetical protein RHMOL_Rhmol05G0195200 [Rhododendron molle]
MVSLTSLCGEIHTISTNKRKNNVHPLLRRVNKIIPAHPTNFKSTSLCVRARLLAKLFGQID